MKNILLLLFVCVCFNVLGQDTTLTERVQLLKAEYRTELLEGSIPKAEKILYRLVRATADHEVLLWAIGEADLATATTSLNSLNTLFGTSYSMPSVIWGSGSTTDSSWVKVTADTVGTGEIKFTAKDTGQVALGSMYVDDGDSTLYFYDGSSWFSLQGASSVAPGTSGDIIINKGGSYGASSYLDTNTVYIDNALNTGFGVDIFSNLEVGGYGNSGFGHDVLERVTTGDQNSFFGSAAGRYVTDGRFNTGVGAGAMSSGAAGDYNTSIGYNTAIAATGGSNIFLGAYAGSSNTRQNNRLYICSINRAGIGQDTTRSIIYGFQAGVTSNQHLYLNANVYVSDSLELNGTKIGQWSDVGGSGTPGGSSGDIQYNNAGSFAGAPMTTDGTDIIITNEIECKDSLELDYAIDAEGDEQWVVMSSTGKLFGDSIADAGPGLTDPLIDFNEWLKDTIDGEIGWIAPNGEKEYTMKGRPSKTIYKLQYMIEMLIRNQVVLEGQIEALEQEVYDKQKNRKFLRFKRKK